MQHIGIYHNSECRTCNWFSDDVPVPSDGPFLLCDYGAADGGATHDLIAKIIGENHYKIKVFIHRIQPH